MAKRNVLISDNTEAFELFLSRKSDYTLDLFYHFINEFQKIAPITIHPGKTMIGISNPRRKIVYVSQLGRNFIHVIFVFAGHGTITFVFRK